MKKLKILAMFIIIGAVSVACAQTPVKTPDAKGENVENAEEAIVTAEQAAANAMKVGSTIPSFSLPDAHNKKVESSELLAESNLVLVFYRGGWCPYCNIYLKKLQDNIDQITAAGGVLVAVSAENPDDSLTTEEKHKLKFHVLSDGNLEYARKMGLVYQLPKDTDEKYKSNGIDLVTDNSMEKPELPISATYIVNREGKIVYAFVEPDYKKRAEPETVIAELKKIKEAARN